MANALPLASELPPLPPPKPPIPPKLNVTQGCSALSFMSMPLLPPAASTVPPLMLIAPSASSGWLSALLADHTVTLPPLMFRLPLESNPSPPLV